MKLETIKILSDQEIKQIHEASMDILVNCGVEIGSPKMLSFLKDKGLKIEEDSVHFTRECIQDALSKIPPTFDVFDREGRYVFTLGDGVPKIAAGHNAVFWVDSETGRTRPSKVSDIEQFARICQDLEYIHMIGIPVMPQDVPIPQASLLYGVKAVMENSAKPIYFSTDNLKINHSIIEMLQTVFPGDLRHQVYGISQLSPTSPLMWEGGVLDAIMDTVGTGVPLAILPEPNAGVSAPFTLAGLLTMNNAECLSGLVMVQLLEPGAKVMYANSWTTTDMRTGAALVGSTETTICRIAAAQLARFYKTPSHTTAPNSDNHAHDEQNAWEKTFSMFCSVAAGHDLVVNCGMFAAGLTCSHEQLIMDEEISAMSKRIAEGVLVNQETIACNLIKQMGHQPEYLTSEHTMRWLHSKEYLSPRVSVRGPRATWMTAGGKDTYQMAREAANKYKHFSGSPLSSARAVKIKQIIEQFGR
ncbi:MAG: trimethylamine methyltransferase family protein [Phycisphaerae bacterium]